VTEQELELFLARFLRDDFLSAVAGPLGRDRKSTEHWIRTYLGEARAGLALVGDRIRTGVRVLEVGAGLCFLSHFLRSQGADIVAIEPGLGGFGKFTQILETVRQWVPDSELDIWNIGADRLDPEQHGRFDLIFSSNVLEHIPDLPAAMAAMARVLKDEGEMIHTCPNYLVPYEPHYSVVLVPGSAALSMAINRRKIQTEPAVWQSLNFVTYFDIVRLAKKNGLQARFERGLLGHALSRLDDPVFRARHDGIAATLQPMLRRFGLMRIIDRPPPFLATPMQFTLRHET
jgi:2-polyprenyl-3-methyl-5-hydroxy-6-metoxy-1,4-benzoquinol methylase